MSQLHLQLLLSPGHEIINEAEVKSEGPMGNASRVRPTSTDISQQFIILLYILPWPCDSVDDMAPFDIDHILRLGGSTPSPRHLPYYPSTIKPGTELYSNVDTAILRQKQTGWCFTWALIPLWPRGLLVMQSDLISQYCDYDLWTPPEVLLSSPAAARLETQDRQGACKCRTASHPGTADITMCVTLLILLSSSIPYWHD